MSDRSARGGPRRIRFADRGWQDQPQNHLQRPATQWWQRRRPSVAPVPALLHPHVVDAARRAAPAKPLTAPASPRRAGAQPPAWAPFSPGPAPASGRTHWRSASARFGSSQGPQRASSPSHVSPVPPLAAAAARTAPGRCRPTKQVLGLNNKPICTLPNCCGKGHGQSTKRAFVHPALPHPPRPRQKRNTKTHPTVCAHATPPPLLPAAEARHTPSDARGEARRQARVGPRVQAVVAEHRVGRAAVARATAVEARAIRPKPLSVAVADAHDDGGGGAVTRGGGVVAVRGGGRFDEGDVGHVVGTHHPGATG